MTRKDFVHQYFQRKKLLTLENAMYRDHVMNLLHWMVQADGITHDIASQSLSLKGKGTAEIISKQHGILGGIEEIAYFLSQETELTFSPLFADASEIAKGDVIANISGDNQQLLAYERTILNVIGRMSGIATATHTLVQKIKDIPHAPSVAATRKTPLMLLDKKAVAVGGGVTHRLHLADWALIKDNHLKILRKEVGLDSLEDVISKAIERMVVSVVPFFEIEVETLDQAEAAIQAFEKLEQKNHMALLLDNFQPEDAKKFVQELQKKSIYQSILIEASGEITQENLIDWAQTGVDVVSLGALTHSVKNFNVSMGM